MVTRNYQYQVLRFRPEPVSDDLRNLALVVFDPSSQQLKSEFVSVTTLTDLTSDVDISRITMVIQYLEKELKQIEDRTSEDRFTPFKSLSEITHQLLPADDGPLFFIGTKTVNAENIEEALRKAALKHSIYL